MKTLYLDIFSGISGDMFLGAMIDLGVDAKKLENELSKLNLEGYLINVSRKTKANIEGVKFDVHLLPKEGEAQSGSLSHSHEHSLSHSHEHSHSHSHDNDEHTHERNFDDIKKLINKSSLSKWVKEKLVAVFPRVAEAEGKVHGMPPDDVHFHEVGAIDSIVDIVGAAICLEWLGVERVISNAVEVGSGYVNCAHGRFPVPAPATQEILSGVPCTYGTVSGESTTPTGAAILRASVDEYEPKNAFIPEKFGYGVGHKDFEIPNVLRIVIGESKGNSVSRSEQHYKIEANIDIFNAEAVNKSLRSDRGVLLITPHLGNIEVIINYLGSEFDCTIPYTKPKNSTLDKVITESRNSLGVNMVNIDSSGIKQILSTLKNNKLVTIASDQVPKEGSGIVSSFFENEIYSMTLVPKLKEKTHCGVHVVFCLRKDNGKGFNIYFSDEIDISSSVKEGVDKMNIEFEERTVELNEGEMLVVPKGQKHKPFAENEAKIMLVEPKDVVNTGNQKNELTAKNDQWV